MRFILSFIVAAGVLGIAIGYTITVHSVATEALIAIGVMVGIWLVFSQAVRPCLTAIDAAVRDAEESASR